MNFRPQALHTAELTFLKSTFHTVPCDNHSCLSTQCPVSVTIIFVETFIDIFAYKSIAMKADFAITCERARCIFTCCMFRANVIVAFVNVNTCYSITPET